MSLFNEDDAPEPQAPAPAVRPKIQPEEYKGITIDTRYTPSSALLTWVEGSNWTVDYYSQVLDANQEPTPQATDRDPIYQQYKLIKGMDLKVTSPLSFNQDPTTNVMSVEGSGITYPFLVPNQGDMFIANIGDGRVGIFAVSSSTRATILRDSVYTIEYKMVSEVNQTRISDFERKTIQTFHYSKHSLVMGCGPFVTEQAKSRTDDFRQHYGELVSRYLTDFISNERMTLLVPDQIKPAYDHFVVRAVLQMIDTSQDIRIRRIRELNIMAESIMTQPTIWDAIVRRDHQRLHGACTKAQLVSTNHFKGRPLMQGLGYSGITRVVYPIDAPTDVDAQYKGKQTRLPVGLPYAEGRPRRPLEGEYVPQAERNALWFQTTPLLAEIPPWRLPPDIHPVVKDDYYVLSEAFYTDDKANQSKLEMLTLQAISGEAINTEQLAHVLTLAYDWDNLERFYYYPILFMLLRAVGVR